MLKGKVGTWKSLHDTLKSQLPFQHGQPGTLKTELPVLKRHHPALKGQPWKAVRSQPRYNSANKGSPANQRLQRTPEAFSPAVPCGR